MRLQDDPARREPSMNGRELATLLFFHNGFRCAAGQETRLENKAFSFENQGFELGNSNAGP
jgi:hypothetical protein